MWIILIKIKGDPVVLVHAQDTSENLVAARYHPCGASGSVAQRLTHDILHVVAERDWGLAHQLLHALNRPSVGVEVAESVGVGGVPN